MADWITYTTWNTSATTTLDNSLWQYQYTYPGAVRQITPEEWANYQEQVRQQQQQEMLRAYSNRFSEQTGITRIAEEKPVEIPYTPEAIEEESGDMKMVNDFLIGCDPEFVAVHGNGRLVDLTVALQERGEIGYDHGGLVGEVRPAPARGAYGLLKKIQRLIGKADKLLNAKLRAGALAQREPAERVYTLGGHVHFDLPAYDYDAREGRKFTEAHKARVVALNDVTAMLEELDILPRNDSKVRREVSQYGRFGDVRTDTSKYNGKHITEYRTMASWLFDPKVAMVCLTAAKLAAAKPREVIELIKVGEFKSLETLFARFKSADINAARVHERLMSKGLKYIQADPTADFRERWEDLGV